MKINKTFIYSTLIAPLIVGVLIDVFTKVEVWKFVSDSAIALWRIFYEVLTWIYENIIWFEIPPLGISHYSDTCKTRSKI